MKTITVNSEAEAYWQMRDRQEAEWWLSEAGVILDFKEEVKCQLKV